jgi:ferredoxin
MRYLKNVVTLAFDESRCRNCGRCLEVCPHAVFAAVNGRVRLADRDACMECGACARNCPFAAVSVRAGVGCAYALLHGGSCDNGDVPGCTGTRSLPRS